MKKLIFLFLIFSCFHAFSQKKDKGTDTTKKIIFTEVVKVDSFNRFELYKKATAWFEKQKFNITEEDPISGKLIATNQFIVYTDKSVLAKPNGDFRYDIQLEVKDGRYRYLFSNFVYRYYKQDRNGKYVPVVKGSKPMEDVKAPGWKKQWSKNKMQVNNHVNNLVNSLKSEMMYVPPKAAVKNEKPKDEW